MSDESPGMPHSYPSVPTETTATNPKAQSELSATPCSANGLPTVKDLRTAARVNRWLARFMDEQRKSWPWWKRFLYEYPTKTLRDEARKHDDMADRLEESSPNMPMSESARTSKK